MNENLYSIEMEQSVLCIFLTIVGADEYIEQLTEDDFFATRHGFIFKQIKKLQQEGKAYDVEVVHDVLKKSNFEGLEADYLMDIFADSKGSAHRLSSYVETLKNYTARRALFSAGERIKVIASDITQYDHIGAVAKSESILAQLESNEDSSSSVYAYDVAVNLFAKIDKRMTDRKNGIDSINGVQTGFEDLDKKLGDIAKGDLVIIGARPSMGKTVIAQDMMIDIAARQNAPVLFQSAEMNSEKVGERFIASIGEIPLSDVKSANIKDEHWGNFTNAALLLEKVSLIIDDKSAPTLTDIRRNCRKIVKKHGVIGAVFIDYLTLLTSPLKTDQNHLAIGAISKGLKGIAKEFNCPVFCLSQLNREVDKRPNKRPMLSDLRESGQIEQDADVIMFLYRDEYYDKASKEAGIVEVIVAKARDGEIGTVRLGSELQYSRFTDLDIPQINEDF